MKKALYLKQSGAVVQWQDDTQFAYAEHSAEYDVLPLDDTYEFPEEQRWVVDGEVVAVDPQIPEPPRELTADEVLAMRDAYLREATLRIAPLQDADDLGEATAAEEAALLAWKRYRIDVSRIDQQPGFPEAVEWPEQPL